MRAGQKARTLQFVTMTKARQAIGWLEDEPENRALQPEEKPPRCRLFARGTGHRATWPF